ncbi:uncharacterized protein LOC105704291 [Orussus abietinus]|uniref:uncharacterized protein LOC105704291 n=1 Tax=Orussus abietinus TaxID=222816 RepID=UPI000C715BF3|nr:uncharacterized protein LOC105704291 [Orussus abietinus]XP_023288574.1 uncharacterized protein LOC105704291 [Orussus abietinus]XP_023288576.1 uncharacterized protein LOC105704291 [Orussus abietinus]XP_023288577.1 uncharacterized protein LOC105704291 [Orussus abietinus]XP_023288579.1 uncharacterized protein LOC105704291 [Orussus abietinus]
MAKLREDLVSEAALWKKQREEFQAHREQSDVLAFEEAITAAWANDPLDMMSVDSAFETFTILEYEKNLARYQNDLAVAHAERRYNVRRQLVATNYRRKLMEVERLCDEELEKIKHNASCLQPLRQIASQWFTNQRSHGDSNLDIIKCSDDRGSADHTDGKNPQDKTSDEYRKIDAEVNMAPEIFAARFNIGDSDVEGNF